jgi:accessory colonization factor AcfC
VNMTTMKINLHVQCYSHQNSNDILHRNRKKILKFIWKQWISKSNPSKKSNAITISDFRLYYSIIINKQHGTSTKTDMYINWIEQKTQN